MQDTTDSAVKCSLLLYGVSLACKYREMLSFVFQKTPCRGCKYRDECGVRRVAQMYSVRRWPSTTFGVEEYLVSLPLVRMGRFS